ncbi:primase C-terminal domain-containing protein [Enterococcus faecium]|uniref:primase C-terminal domain-containing protein n=1 Tax=Enterococcus faecium TaxID=1352 RepID=UPI0019FD5D2C|nr:primase C-terminal domain-containing protein [Enterococcus faecium]EGP4915053.1 replication protein RepR [Enterococcus faecium]EGP5169427.1 replication protein RepR [Enterococcus faecium]EGP5559793.1 replication protein RepR [Enterococcus faecium]EME3542215.1 primase C-terminal domain-containing protein [Enterococcus faecium]EME7205224.1 primase C-terminal domain-containing protein [Enterococcus faecium]
MENLDKCYGVLLKQGIRTYKYRNSTMKPVGYENTSRNGAIFAYRSKKLMNAGRGMVITSEEAILENELKLTHWTPNVYRYGTYVDENRTVVKGHSEKNLSQINTFVVDIDSKENHQGEIILACIDELGYMPTMILESEHGYQVYFVLKTPAFVTKKSNFKVIEVAKRISIAIRTQLANQLTGIDVGCNHFGIARFPNKQNIVFFELENQYSFSDWLNWSMKMASNQKTEEERNAKLVVFPEKKEYRQVDEPWFDLLLRKANIIGGKGRLGRNNVIFTLSLAYYSSGYGQETCEYNMFEFNERLNDSLTEGEVRKIVKSTYSGNYQAANRDFILELCQEWVASDIQEKELFIQRRGWWKFKKPREQREYSHKHEWQEDIMRYLSEKSDIQMPYLRLSKKELAKQLKMPLRSLDRALSALKQEHKVFYHVKKGRGGGLLLASIRVLFASLIQAKKEEKEAFIRGIMTQFNLRIDEWQRTIQFLLPEKEFQEISLFEVDTG